MQLSNLRKIEDLDPRFQPVVEQLLERWALDPWLAGHGMQVVITDGFRMLDEQARLWGIGRELRDGKWIITGRTVTKLQDSPHCHGMAIDAAPWRGGKLLYPDVLQHEGAGFTAVMEAREAFYVIGAAGEAAGLEWGGRFGESSPGVGDGWDKPHLQLAGWKAALA